MKTINLKLILTFCILGTLFLNTHALGDETPNSLLGSGDSTVKAVDLGVDLTPHLTGEKIIFFTNWTAAYHNDPNGAIKVIAECMDLKRISTQLGGSNLVMDESQKSVSLPASGYNWSDYWDGTVMCEGDMIRLRAVISFGGEIGDVASNEPLKLYKNGVPVKTDPNGHPLINYSCFGSGFQFPFIRYMTADYGLPAGHTDPNGYYALFDSCRR